MRRRSRVLRRDSRHNRHEAKIAAQLRRMLPADFPETARKARALVAAARCRARTKNLPFSLTDLDRIGIQAALEFGRCELSGQPFGAGPHAPTLDRIEPARGYVAGNVRVVCRLMNFALGDWGEDVLRDTLARWLATPRPAAPQHYRRRVEEWRADPAGLFD